MHFETGEVQYIPAVATDNKRAAMMGDEPFEYYGTSRAWSPGWVNRYTIESIEPDVIQCCSVRISYLSYTIAYCPWKKR